MSGSRTTSAGLALRAAIVLIGSCTALAAMSLPARAAAGVAPSARPVGQPPAPPAGSVAVGTPASDQALHLDVVLQPSDSAGLAALATAVSTPGSGLYHQYLARGEFATRFGATPATLAAVESSLRAHGLNPGTPLANNLTIPVDTTVEAAAAAFAVRFEQDRLPSGRVAYRNAVAPSLDSSVAPAVMGIVGLDDLAQPQHTPIIGPASTPRVAAPATSPNPSAPCASFPSGAYTPGQLLSTYGASSLSSDTGTGQTVALYELDDYSSTDIGTYESCVGVSPTIIRTAIAPMSAPGGGAIEVEADIEAVAGLAPGAAIHVYEAPQSSAQQLYAQIASDDTAKVVSTSWGLCESALGSTGAQAEALSFEQMATQGQTIFAAAGDNGSEDCTTGTALAVDDPASQPDVTGVGGTTLSSVSPRTEAVWDNTSLKEGGGGGVSRLWTMPTWQAAPGVISRLSSGTPCSATSGNCREVPDVSASADPNFGYGEFCTVGSQCSGSTWFRIGGTSLGAPLWAAFTAIANQVNAANTSCIGGSAGFLNPTLYQLASSTSTAASFNDVTTGNNDVLLKNSGEYPATTGYDMASGLGTPNLTNLVAGLCAATSTTPAPDPQVSPTTLPFGTVAGNATPMATQSTTITNQAAATADLTVSLSISGTNAADFAIDPTTTCSSAAIAPGASCTATVDFTPKAGAPETATLDVQTNASANPITVALSGTDSTPAAPGTPAATAGNASATVSWTAPAGSGTSSITGYTLTVTPVCSACTGTTTTGALGTTVGNLTNGTTYQFRVTATNTSGAGAPSGLSNAVVPTAPVVGGGGAGGGGGGGGGGGAPTTTTAPPSTTTTTAPPTTTPGVQAQRIGGTSRVDTAVLTSQQSFPSANSAGVVVLARSDLYPDALAGTPLAVAQHGPLLLTETTGLDPEAQTEIQRVLTPGGTVYLLGGAGALDPSIDQALAGLGFKPVRLQGADRYQTALAVAQALGNPTTILLATGSNFPDALSGGPAAAKASGAVLLTNGSGMDPSTAGYLSAHPGDKVFALGGPAAAADPAATPIVGADRYQTAVMVAQRFFSGVTSVGTASGTNFPDALAGGAAIAELGGPMLLTDPSSVSSALAGYLTANRQTIQRMLVFGGSGAVSDGVLTAINGVLG